MISLSERISYSNLQRQRLKQEKKFKKQISEERELPLNLYLGSVYFNSFKNVQQVENNFSFFFSFVREKKNFHVKIDRLKPQSQRISTLEKKRGGLKTYEV